MDTIVIDNFTGALTRKINGDLNSGMANFVQSWGYDPFSKPGNLTWLEAPVDITGPIANMPLAAKVTQNSAQPSNASVFLFDAGKKFYAITPNTTSNANVDSVVSISSIAANMPGTLSYSASMEFFGDTLQVYIGTEKQINQANFDGTSDTVIGQAARYTSNVYRPLKVLAGKLFFGNGPTVGAIDSTGTVTSPVSSVAGSSNLYTELNPPLTRSTLVQDLQTSIDGNYLLILGAETNTSDNISATLNDLNQSQAVNSTLYRWNTTDKTITALTYLPTHLATAIKTYLGNTEFFSNDNFGAAMSDEQKKILMMPNNKAPFPNAVAVNGNFLSWACAEVVGTTRYASFYYFGSLDADSPVGLYRLMRWATTQSSAQVFQVPLNILVGSNYQSLNTSFAVATFSYGKHYIGVTSVNTSGTYQSFLLRFLTTPIGTGTSQLGVYQTQTQLFSKRISVKQIRVYTEPTAANNGFQIDLIGSDGTVITNGTFTYTFAAGTDITKLQGALERIDFNPAMKNTYALGVRITNTGTANMTIKKIEIDPEITGK